MRLTVAVAIAFALKAGAVLAQPVPSRDPSSTHIFPAGARRGTVTRVRVGSECLPPGARLRVWGAGVSAPADLGRRLPLGGEPSPRRLPAEIPITYPKEWDSAITIAGDAPLGVVMWRLSCSQGGTGARPFIVGDLPEFVETESNSRVGRAERVSMPVTINGQISGERDLDYFVFRARQGDVVTCEVIASRLGSPLEAVVEVMDASRRRLEVEEFRVGSDPVVSFRARASGDYTLLISNLGVYGSPKYVYRVTLSTVPYFVCAFPAGGRVGETRKMTLWALSGEPALREIAATVTFPATAGEFRFFPGPGGGPNSVALVASDFAEVVETEPNDGTATATRLTLPATVNGRFLAVDDEDWFTFRARAGSRYSVRCRPFPAGLSTLPIVSLVNGGGEVLARASAVDSALRECRVEWRATGDGDVFLRVRDLQKGIRGGPYFVYRLSLSEDAPDFELEMSKDFLHVVQGATEEVELAARRSGGFDGAIALEFEGAPDGVRIEPAEIPKGASSVKLKFSAAAGARPADWTVRVVGRAKAGKRELVRTTVAPHWGLDPEGISVGTPRIDNLHLTVRHKPVFRLFCAEAYQYAHRGTVFRYPMELERLEGYDGEIVLQIGDRQNRDLDGVEMFEVTVPPETTTVHMPIYLPETMHINVQSQSQLYVQGWASFTDSWGGRQSVLVVSEKRCMIRTMPTVTRLVSTAASVRARPGDSLECGLRLDRTSNFPGPMRVELIAPSVGFRAEPVTIAAGQTRARLPLRVEDGVVPEYGLAIVLRGTGKLPDGTVVISEARVPVDLRAARF